MSRDLTPGAHYVAPVTDDPPPIDAVHLAERKSNLWLDAWRDLRRRPLFWIAVAFAGVLLLMALWPSLFTQVGPNENCVLTNSNAGPAPGHPLGFTFQGCDIWARIVWGTRVSLAVGLLATLIGTAIGLVAGSLAGFYGGWVDSVLSRVGDIFFTIPYIIAAIVVMTVLSDYRNPLTLAFAIGGFSWAGTARIVRAEILRVKQSDYVTASIAIGLSKLRTLFVHVVPNSIAPVIVVAAMGLGLAIVAEATLSWLGVGIPGTVSWGNDIQQAQTGLRNAPMALIYPSIALTLAVLAFVTIGELLRDAIDPKARAQR